MMTSASTTASSMMTSATAKSGAGQMVECNMVGLVGGLVVGGVAVV